MELYNVHELENSICENGIFFPNQFKNSMQFLLKILAVSFIEIET